MLVEVDVVESRKNHTTVVLGVLPREPDPLHVVVLGVQGFSA